MTDQEYKDMTRVTTEYEWDWEETETADQDSDIIDHHFCEPGKLTPCRLDADKHVRLVLVRSTGTASDGVEDRAWAYVTPEGELPQRFDNGVKVPKKYREQFNRFVFAHGVAVIPR